MKRVLVTWDLSSGTFEGMWIAAFLLLSPGRGGLFGMHLAEE